MAKTKKQKLIVWHRVHHVGFDKTIIYFDAENTKEEATEQIQKQGGSWYEDNGGHKFVPWHNITHIELETP